MKKPGIGLGVVLSFILGGMAFSANGQMTPQQAIIKMTRGFNFGRCLETAQENHFITASEMDDVKAAGFNFVRLPIQWDQHMGGSPPYTIDSTWLDRVQQVVDWAIARDLIIIINSHHDEWIDGTGTGNQLGDLERFKALWTQVGARFQNHSDKLLFEIINEPALGVANVNTINDAIFPIIRAISPTRIILFGGPGQSYNRLSTCTYPANDNYLIGEIHNYDPSSFAVYGTNTWGTVADYQAVTNIMEPAAAWSAANNIPVVLGEYGSVGWCDPASRELYVKAMTSAAAAHGFAPCVWHDYGWFGIYYPNNPPATRWSAVKDWIMAVTLPAPDDTINVPPTLDAPGNVMIHQSAGQQVVNLTGISSGSSNEVQTLTVSAVSSHPALIPTPAVNYTSPNTNGMLTFTPVPYLTGTSTLTVTVNDGQWSSNVVSRAFTVTVSPLPNLPFVITEVSVRSNTVGLTWESTAGKLYAIEYSRDLLTWSNLLTDIPAAGTNTSVVRNLAHDSTGTNDLLVRYEMGQLGPQIQDATRTLAGGDLTKGSGLATFNPDSTQAYPTAPSLAVTFNAVTPDLATAVGNDSVFTFVLTAGSNVTDLDLNSLTFNAARGGAGTPRGYAVFVTTPTTTDQQVQSDTELTTQRTDWGFLQNVDLASVTSLQNLTAGQTVTVMIPVYSPSPGSSLDFDNIDIYGMSTYGSVLAGTDAKEVFLRVRQ